MKTINAVQIKKIAYAALCLSLALLLPFLTGQIPEIGQALSPMHIPAFLCGFICGPLWGLIVGFIAPLLRSIIFQMPPLPVAIPMAFELAAYGVSTGILHKLLPKKIPFIYVTLISSMIIGRIIWGVAKLIFTMINAESFTFAAFISGAITAAIPGIICHIVLVPLIIIALKKARLLAEGI